jgi:CheY-like chemotaxis protein
MAATVLVVDDDDAIRESLVWMLQAEGHKVVEAPDGQLALERLRDHPMGLVVLLDINLSGVDGIAVMQAVEAEVPLASCHA